MNAHQPQTRRQLILQAALETFGTYGYRRCSMDDIAKVAGISRPALYQIFANKADIYRAVVVSMMTDIAEAAKRELYGDAPLEERLYAALDASLVAPHASLEAMPHGAELLGIKDEVAQDLMDEWDSGTRARLRDVLTEKDTIAPQRAADIADLVMLAVNGLKARGACADEMRDSCRQIARTMAAAAYAGR